MKEQHKTTAQQSKQNNKQIHFCDSYNTKIREAVKNSINRTQQTSSRFKKTKLGKRKNKRQKTAETEHIEHRQLKLIYKTILKKRTKKQQHKQQK